MYWPPVELVDLFPTLVGLAGLAAPPEAWHLPGTDLSPVLRSGRAVKPVNAAFGQITRCRNCTEAYSDAGLLIRGCSDDAADAAHFYVACAKTPRQHFDLMGYSVRTPQWRYSLFCRWNGTTLRGVWSTCTAPELFDHANDTALFAPDHARRNLAGCTDPRCARAEAQLRAMIRAAFPVE